MLRIDRPAEPFEGVVVGIRNHDVIDHGTGACAGKGEAVDLFVRLEGITGVLDADIAEDPRIVSRLIPAVMRTGTAFDLRIAVVHRSFAAKHQSAPVAAVTKTNRCIGGENNRIYRSTVGKDLSSPFNDKGSYRGFVPFDDGTGLNGEGRAIDHVNKSAKKIGMIRTPGDIPRDLSGDDHCSGIGGRYGFRILTFFTRGKNKEKGQYSQGQML